MSAFHTAASVTPIKVGARAGPTARQVPQEVPVAIVCNGTSVAVMMATPSDLEDFAIGFVLSERIVEGVEEIEGCEILAHEKGVEARLWIAEERARSMLNRRRAMAGPTGCGLCGIESLDEVQRRLPRVSDGLVISWSQISHAMGELRGMQALNAMTRAVHAAAVWRPGQGIGVVREDVGRHNALDKAIGAMARTKMAPGALLLTSRVSIELVQKAAFADMSVIIAVSVPTLAAIENAASAGITLVAIARDDGYEVFTRPDRIDFSRDVDIGRPVLGGGALSGSWRPYGAIKTNRRRLKLESAYQHR